MTLLLSAGMVSAALILNAWSHYKMSQSLDALTASVGNLETAAAAVVTEVVSLKAGTDDAALDALKTRIDTVTTNLNGAVPPAS